MIEAHFKLSMEKLAAHASDLKERQASVKGDRYAKKKHGALRDEPEQFREEEKPTDMEDEQGYLPEERQSYD